jgi:hypothetical protein
MAQKLNTNTSVVDYLKSQGKNSTFEARANLAVKQGIVDNKKDYTGSGPQNTALLSSLKADDKKQTPKLEFKDTKPQVKDDKKDTKKDTPKPQTKEQNFSGDLADLIESAIPDGGNYTYSEIQQMATSQPVLRSAAELAQLYGLDYNMDHIYKTLLNSVDAGYAARYNQQSQAEDKYYDNAATAQSTLLDTLKQQQSQAIMSGTNKGMQAAQALSSMLGTSQQFAASATQLAKDRQQIAKEYSADRAATGVKALDEYNAMGNQLADISKNLYSSDTSAYVGQLDYNASVNTANAQMASQAMASKAQWESSLANAMANAYTAYYNGQITLDQARIQADAAIQSAKVYGLDSAKVTAQANKQIAATNAAATTSAATIAANATQNAAQTAANATTGAAQISADSYAASNAAATQQNMANVVAGLIAGYNANPTNADSYIQALDGYYASGAINDSLYNSTKKLFKSTATTTPATTTTPSTSGTTSGGPAPVPAPTPTP